MAFINKISICPGCNVSELFDITGAYDAVTNTTGYGGPNPQRSDLTSLVLTLILANTNQAVGTYDVTAEYQTAVANNVDFSVEYEPADFGITNIPDGVHTVIATFVYNVLGTPVTYTANILVFYTCEKLCYIGKLSDRLQKEICSCDNDQNVSNFNAAVTYYEQLCISWKNGNMTAVQLYDKKLTELLQKTTNCKTC